MRKCHLLVRSRYAAHPGAAVHCYVNANLLHKIISILSDQLCLKKNKNKTKQKKKLFNVYKILKCQSTIFVFLLGSC